MTTTAFLIGHPVDHSRSPLLHCHWLSVYGIAGDYRRIDVPPGGLSEFCASLRHGPFVGGNVTVPHKQALIDLCDEVDATARVIGAVNTLVLRDSVLFGSNSDWIGFTDNLDAESPDWDENPGPALVLGAGGSARAIVLGLGKRGFAPIRILNRTLERATALAAELGPALGTEVSGHELSRFAELAPDARILVNTTIVGMNGTRYDDLDLGQLPADALVTDIVYTPIVTPLLADAAARGLRIVDGLGMLLYQAVPGFEAWFGTRPGVTADLRRLIEKDMGLK